MQAVVLFLNDRADDPTKRLKLAGVRRYAAAAGWNVVPIPQERSGRKSIPDLLAKYRPAGCICSEDDSPAGLSPRLFGGIPLVLANEHRRRYDALCGRVCVDNAAVARAAFRELSSGNPEAFAVVTEATSHEWSAVRVRAFRAEASNTGRPCPVYREIRWTEREEALVALRPWLAALPRHTAIYAVNDPLARRVANAALGAGLRIPQDLTILGTDNNLACCEPFRPTLSSIQLDFERMGYLAAKMLGERIQTRADARAEEADTRQAASDMRVSKRRKPSSMSRAACRVSGPAAEPPTFSVITVGPLLPVRRESTGGRGRREPHILEAVEIIRREACDGLTVAALAERLPGSRRLLDLRFREAMGHSVLDEIVQVRLERVFDLLRRPEMPIGAIANFSGFALHQLDKVFRARFGCSLRDWRKRNVQP